MPALRSREAGFAVYLVDPGPDVPGLLVLLQEVSGLDREAAALTLRDLPALVALFETEAAARNLAARLRDFDAVAVVRPADQPLAPAPVEEPGLFPAQRLLQWVLAVLGAVQIGVAALWLAEGRPAAAFFGFCLGVYVLVYFGARLRRSG